jgi:membrane protease YdiL (CAAX protease family)
MNFNPDINPPTDSGLERQEPTSPPSSSPVWSGWDILLLLFFTFFTVLVVGTMGHAASHVLQVKFPALVKIFRHPASEGVSLLLFQAFLDGLILVYIFLTISLKYNSPFWASIKWERRQDLPLLPYLPMGILLAFAILGISTLVPNPGTPPIEQLLKFPITILIYAVLGVLVAPFVEEMLFRGFIYPVVERRSMVILGRLFLTEGFCRRYRGQIAKMLAILTTAVLFTSMHISQLWGSWSGIILILFVGLTLSTVRARTGSVIPGFIIHLSYNSTICLLFFASTFIKGVGK